MTEDKSAIESKTVTLEDGRIVDPESGEVVGFNVPEEFKHEAAMIGEEVKVDLAIDGPPIETDRPTLTESFVNWIMSKRLKYDAKRVSATISRNDAARDLEVIIQKAIDDAMKTPEYITAKTIVDNSERMVKEADYAIRYFDGYAPELGRYADRILGDGKVRNVKTPFGTISLTKGRKTIEVADTELFFEWADKNAPTAVKKSVLISELPDEVSSYMQNPQGKPPTSLTGKFASMLKLNVGETKVVIKSNIEGVSK